MHRSNLRWNNILGSSSAQEMSVEYLLSTIFGAGAGGSACLVADFSVTCTAESRS